MDKCSRHLGVAVAYRLASTLIKAFFEKGIQMKTRKKLLAFTMFILSMFVVYGGDFGTLRVVSGTANTVWQRVDSRGRFWPWKAVSQIQSETTLYNVSVFYPVPGMVNYFTEFRSVYSRADPQRVGYYWNQSRIEINSYQSGSGVIRATNDCHDIPNEFYVPGIGPAWGTYSVSTSIQRYTASSSATLLLTNHTDRPIEFILQTFTYGKTNRYTVVSPPVQGTSAIRWRPPIAGGQQNMVLLDYDCRFVPEDPYN